MILLLQRLNNPPNAFSTPASCPSPSKRDERNKKRKQWNEQQHRANDNEIVKATRLQYATCGLQQFALGFGFGIPTCTIDGPTDVQFQEGALGTVCTGVQLIDPQRSLSTKAPGIEIITMAQGGCKSRSTAVCTTGCITQLSAVWLPFYHPALPLGYIATQGIDPLILHAPQTTHAQPSHYQ